MPLQASFLELSLASSTLGVWEITPLFRLLKVFSPKMSRYSFLLRCSR
jgi:hypothetical protein